MIPTGRTRSLNTPVLHVLTDWLQPLPVWLGTADHQSRRGLHHGTHLNRGGACGVTTLRVRDSAQPSIGVEAVARNAHQGDKPDAHHRHHKHRIAVEDAGTSPARCPTSHPLRRCARKPGGSSCSGSHQLHARRALQGSDVHGGSLLHQLGCELTRRKGGLQRRRNIVFPLHSSRESYSVLYCTSSHGEK